MMIGEQGQSKVASCQQKSPTHRDTVLGKSFMRNNILNPLTLKSDQHQISPYNITSESNIWVLRIEEMITN